MPERPLVDVWWVDLDVSATDEPSATYLDPGELEQAERFVFAHHRFWFEQRRLALRMILARYLHGDPAALRFDRSCQHCGDRSHGKPALAGTSDLHFSASSTGTTAAIAVSRRAALGLDVERIVAGDPHRQPPLLRQWTWYEAVTKGTGRGIVDLSGFDALPSHHRRVPCGWTVVDLPAPLGLLGALAVDSLVAPSVTHHQFTGAVASSLAASKR